jgi:hypothetical protein
MSLHPACLPLPLQVLTTGSWPTQASKFVPPVQLCAIAAHQSKTFTLHFVVY